MRFTMALLPVLLVCAYLASVEAGTAPGRTGAPVGGKTKAPKVGKTMAPADGKTMAPVDGKTMAPIIPTRKPVSLSAEAKKMISAYLEGLASKLEAALNHYLAGFYQLKISFWYTVSEWIVISFKLFGVDISKEAVFGLLSASPAQ